MFELRTVPQDTINPYGFKDCLAQQQYIHRQLRFAAKHLIYFALLN